MTKPDLTGSGPPPVTPISDVGWARIERDLWARLDSDPVPRVAASPPSTPPRRRWQIAIPLLAVAAAAVIVVVALRRDEVEPGERVASRVVAGAAASSITVGDIHVDLDPEAVVVVAPVSNVERGAAWFEVAPRGDRPPFVVTAGDVKVVVVGTRFRVARVNERVEVAVAHGRVRVVFRGNETYVGANETWSSEPKAATIGAGVIGAGVIAPPPVPPVRPVPPVIDAGVAAWVSDQARFERLDALELRDPSAAIAGYLVLANEPSVWAPVAAFAAARLASERHDPRATTLLTTYLQRFPDGANAADARKLLTPLTKRSP